MAITIDQVRTILPTGVSLTDAQIQAAIDAAQCLIDSGACTQCQDQYGIYLAAHFAAVTENTLSLSSEKDGCCDASATYGFKFGEGIMGTPFGQMANTLSGGCLKANEQVTPASASKATLGIYSIGCA